MIREAFFMPKRPVIIVLFSEGYHFYFFINLHQLFNAQTETIG